jgi:hypothetical protein
MALNDPLIWARAIHFIATISAAGIVFFLAFVGELAWSPARMDRFLPWFARGSRASYGAALPWSCSAARRGSRWMRRR